jgi:glycolate oxidase
MWKATWSNPVSRTVKCATGYNLTGLMVGSEGTLGVFCRNHSQTDPAAGPSQGHDGGIRLVWKKHPKPSPPSLPAGSSRHLEFLDNFTIRAVEDFSKAGLPKDAAAMLLVELDGHAAQVEEDAEPRGGHLPREGATSVRVARDAAERDRVWAARRAALSALAQLKPTLVLEDATVPRSRIPDMVAAIQQIAKRYDLTIGTFGHAGDGNLHPTILTDKRNAAEWERVEQAIDDIFDEALKHGRHPLRRTRHRYWPNHAIWKRRPAPARFCFHQRIKRAMDPNNILNPGKIIAAKA